MKPQRYFAYPRNGRGFACTREIKIACTRERLRGENRMYTWKIATTREEAMSLFSL